MKPSAAVLSLRPNISVRSSRAEAQSLLELPTYVFDQSTWEDSLRPPKVILETPTKWSAVYLVGDKQQ